MKKKTVRWFLIGIMLTTLFLSACQNATPEEPEVIEEVAAEVDYNPDDSPPLRLAVTRPTQLNPLMNGNDSLYQVYHLVFESLITFDEAFDVEPLLAESWEVDELGLSVTFQLRENITWHDGEPFLPEDVIFTVQVLKEKAASIQYPNLYVNNIQQISDVRKTGDHSVRITFTRPFSNALETLVFPILPQHLFAGGNRNLLNTAQFPMVGTGRYQVANFDASRSMKLEYYPAYWGRKPYIEEIDITIVPDKEAQLSLFESGEIDLVEPMSVDWLKYTDQEKVSGFTYPSTQYEFIGFNFRLESWKNRELRQAVSHALDRESIINTIFFGHGSVTNVPMQPASWLYEEESGTAAFDPERARELVAEALLPEDAVFTLLTNAENPMRVKTAEVIADSLEEAGLAVAVEALGWNELQERLAAGEFDMVLTGWHFSMIPDLSFAFHSTQEEMGNFIGYQNEAMDQLLETAFAAPNRARKEEAWHRIQQHIAAELPYVSLFYKEYAVLYRTTLRGELTPIQFNIFRGIETAYLIRPRDEAAEASENEPR
ncbi:MAG: ABC transporter substrate-binding protein [Bacillota bacterium]|nr:ABC transporter substrate-binding protein [Bacillota bacterium]MDW7677730.1 ABC transporter substrate-binding protein [Bacillota bacterium]